MENKEFSLKEIVEQFQQQYLELEERAKTEPISCVELMRPLQYINNLYQIALYNEQCRIKNTQKKK